MQETHSKLGEWTSYWGFVFAATGAAVGLGNVWKFPYIAGENGGGAFVLIYLLFIAVVGVPLLIAEIMLGRHGRKNPAHAIANVAEESGCSRRWGLVGGLIIITGFLILTYYSVIAGWALDYVYQAAAAHFHQASAEHIQGLFDKLIASPWILGFWHTVIMVATVAVVSLGVSSGLERAALYLFPAMLALLLVIVGYSMDTGFFAQGVEFLFKPDFSKITANVLLEAIGHSFFTLSLATGSIMMYGAYVPSRVSIVKTALFIAGADTAIALISGLAIFPIVFANGLQLDSGPGLIFKTLPLAFGHMPYETFIATIFFIMLVFAAFTSALSLLEPSVAWCIETFNFTRKKAVVIVGFSIWLLGFITIFSFNIWSDVKILGLGLFDFIDTITANYMMPFSGMCIAIFAAWKMRRKDELSELQLSNKWLFKFWHYSLGIIAPVAILLVFLQISGLLSFMHLK